MIGKAGSAARRYLVSPAGGDVPKVHDTPTIETTYRLIIERKRTVYRRCATFMLMRGSFAVGKVSFTWGGARVK
jgi:hypothetical protein